MAKRVHFQTHIILPVKGMTCFTCWVEILAVLRKIRGILEVQPEFESESFRITFQPDKVSMKRIVATLKKRGYDACFRVHAHSVLPDPPSQAA